MKKIAFYILLYLIVAPSFAQPKISCTYSEFVAMKRLSERVSKAIQQLENAQDAAGLLSYTDTLVNATLVTPIHLSRAWAFVLLADTVNTQKELKLHLEGYPDALSEYVSKKIGLSVAEVERYKALAKEEYQKKNYPHQDSMLSQQLREMYKKDQYRRVFDSLGVMDSTQLVYDKENTAELKRLVKEYGHWIGRYLAPDIMLAHVIVMHMDDNDKFYFLPYLIEDCERGDSRWETAEQVVWRSMFNSHSKYGYRKLYNIVLNEQDEIDFEQSLLGIHKAAAFLQYDSRITLQATVSFKSSKYVQELERLKQYYVSLGVKPENIDISTEKVSVVELPNEPTPYVVMVGHSEGV